MMKNYQNKVMGEGPDAILICVAACVIPDLGAWEVGDKITDPCVAEKLLNHPNFKLTTEEK